MRNYWNASLACSVLFHYFIVIGMPLLGGAKVGSKKIESQAPRVFELKDIDIISQKNEPPIVKDSVSGEKNYPAPPYIGDFMDRVALNNENSFFFDKSSIDEGTIREVVVSEIIDSSLKKLPKYMDYYYRIIAQISKTAHKRYQYGGDDGTVILNFTILKNGRLESVVLENQPAASSILRDIAKKSVYDASPFPPFPEEFKERSSLAFSMTINFETH